MFIYQTKKRELYYERVIALYQQTGYGKKRLGKLFPEIGEKTISRWMANFVSENPQVASMRRAKPARTAPVQAPEVQSEKLPTDVQELQAELKGLRAQLPRPRLGRKRATNSSMSKRPSSISRSEKKLAPSSRQPVRKEPQTI